jgi:glycosyltransferase involved in cell wall biosynthesis
MAEQLSVVMPVYNERYLVRVAIERVLRVESPLISRLELIVVDDGSTDGTTELVEELARERPELRGVRLRRNFGKSAALAAGIDRCRGETIVTIDGDGQDDPADIPLLLGALEQGADLVSGWKRDRRDPLSRRFASRVFNWFTARLTGVSMHDMNCGFKAYRGECARSLEIYGELHRFLPVLADQQGWSVTEVAVNHRPRRFGRSRFGLERYLRGALDLLAVIFVGRYEYRPLHLFGGIGLVLTAAGVVISAYLTVLKIAGESIGSRPLLFLGVLLIVVGIQLLTFGLLAQMVVIARRDGTGSGLKPAQIERLVGFRHDPPSAADGSSRSTRETTPAG